MRALNKQAQKIFDQIIEDLRGPRTHKKIDNNNGTFMPLSVEKLYTHDVGTVYSFCHYFKQNGDLCQDPEMLFMKTKLGSVAPMMFQQYPGIYSESIFSEDGKWKIKRKLKADHASFANMWMKNIKSQQGL